MLIAFAACFLEAAPWNQCRCQPPESRGVQPVDAVEEFARFMRLSR
jgi:hypothetical protein